MGEGKLVVSVSKRGREKGYCLTEPAHRVLQQITREGFQTFQELRYDALKGKNRTYSWNLMNKLVKMNRIKVIRGDGGEIRGWSITSASFRPPVYKTSFEHDSTLREIKRILCESPAIVNWAPEHVLRAEAMNRFSFADSRQRNALLLTVPDAMMQFQCRGKDYRAALELEITRKTKKRIFHKIESHILNSEFQYAFYIAGDEKLHGLLWNIYNEVLRHSVRVKLRSQQNGIYFITLENLRKHGLDAEFKGLRDTLRFRDLST